jgi:hypothetical protein
MLQAPTGLWASDSAQWSGDSGDGELIHEMGWLSEVVTRRTSLTPALLPAKEKLLLISEYPVYYRNQDNRAVYNVVKTIMPAY